MTGFTTGETLKAWNWHDDGRCFEAIKLRVNRARRAGYLAELKLPNVTALHVEKMLRHVGAVG